MKVTGAQHRVRRQTDDHHAARFRPPTRPARALPKCGDAGKAADRAAPGAPAGDLEPARRAWRRARLPCCTTFTATVDVHSPSRPMSQLARTAYAPPLKGEHLESEALIETDHPEIKCAGAPADRGPRGGLRSDGSPVPPCRLGNRQRSERRRFGAWRAGLCAERPWRLAGQEPAAGGPLPQPRHPRPARHRPDADQGARAVAHVWAEAWVHDQCGRSARSTGIWAECRRRSWCSASATLPWSAGTTSRTSTTRSSSSGLPPKRPRPAAGAPPSNLHDYCARYRSMHSQDRNAGWWNSCCCCRSPV